MKRLLQAVCVSVSAFMLFSAPLAYSAETAAKDKAKYPVGTVFGKDGKPLPPAGVMEPLGPKPLTATGPALVAEGNRIDPGSVTVNPLPCRDLEYSGDVILPVNRGDDYECPAGYECKGVVGGVQCRWRNLTNVAANSPDCRVSRCSSELLGEALGKLGHH